LIRARDVRDLVAPAGIPKLVRWEGRRYALRDVLGRRRVRGASVHLKAARSRMSLFPRTLRFWTALVVVLWSLTLQASPAVAGLAPSRLSGATAIASSRDADLIVIQRALENRVVAQKLRDYGVAPDDVQLRVANMSDRDVHTLATATKGLPTGGDDGLGVIISLLLIVVLVLVILKLMNKQVVVK
jgi:hypothetical protein